MMLNIIAVILICMWVLGMMSSQSMGNFIHLLLVVAVVLVLIRIIRGKSPV